MDLLPSADQAAMVEAVERFLDRELSTAHLRERLGTGSRVAGTTWRTAANLGIFAMGLPEDAGGAACPVVEEALVFRALGRQLAPVGFLATVLATRLAHAAGDTRLHDALAAGFCSVALALPALPEAEYLDVIDLPGAAFLVHGSGSALAPAPPEPAVERLDSLDPSCELGRVPVAAPAAGLDVPAAEGVEISLLGTLLAAAMLAGTAEAARDASVAHARDRVQFGRPIGAHQAIKHVCADMATRCEAATSLMSLAALLLRDGRPGAEFQVAAAKRIATSAALDNARACEQVHGGLGVTWEHDAHLFLTRAHVLDRMFGDVRHQQRTLLTAAPVMTRPNP